MDQTARRRRRNLIQNIAIALLSVSAVLLFAQLQLYNLGTSEDPLYLERLTGEGSPSRLREFPAPVRVVLTDSYGRYGSLGFTTNSDGFSALGLREALGSVQHLAPSTTDAFRGALSGPSIYFDFLNPLPLQVLAELTGAEGTALEGNARCLLLAAGQMPEIATAEAPEEPSPWLDAVRARPARALSLPDAPNLPLVMLRQLRRAPSRPLLADNGRILTARAFWIRAVALSLHLRRRLGSGQRVGIMLPASSAACVAWLAVLLAGQTPVMLNWTTGPRNLGHCLRLAGVRHILSARALLDRLEGSGLREAAEEAGAAWLPLEDTAASLSPCLRLEAACRALLSLAGLEGCAVPRKLSRPAAILFTSGSSAAPKGVPLSHDNILANCRDVAAILALDSHDAMLAMLPPFHTLGLTGNIVLPLCFGVPVVFHANPTEGARLDAVCRQWRPTLLVAAPTFLDGMLRQARPGDLASLRVAFVGAEACPQRLYDDFARLSGGGLLCEGYGVTECSPVISLNLPTDARTGTIGQPLPSVRTAIVSVQEPRQRLAAGETGLLLVRGPNVFGGYLGQGSDGGPASPFLHLDGEDWYCTGDLVRADSNGHMTFAGRRERFVKLGGEMISLPQMEAVLGRHFMAPAGQEGPVLAVDALEEEGQTVLVLFTTLPLEREQANAVLREEGLSALYMLRRVRRLAALPLLGSGKVDYRSLRALAMQEGQGV